MSVDLMTACFYTHSPLSKVRGCNYTFLEGLPAALRPYSRFFRIQFSKSCKSIKEQSSVVFIFTLFLSLNDLAKSIKCSFRWPLFHPTAAALSRSRCNWATGSTPFCHLHSPNKISLFLGLMAHTSIS